MRSTARIVALALAAAFPSAAWSEPGSDAMAGPPEVPNLPNASERLEVMLPVCNVSASAATGVLLVRLVVNQDAAPPGGNPILDATVEIPNIDPGACSEEGAKFEVTLPESGGYDFTFDVDPDQESGDANPDNNHGYKHVVAS